MNEQFDKDLRAALLDAAQLDYQQAFEDPDFQDISFSFEYKRKMARMLADPFNYVKQESKNVIYKVLKMVACFAIVVSVTFGALMLVPELRMFILNENSNVGFISTDLAGAAWYPQYIPEGFTESVFLRKDNIISIEYKSAVTIITFMYYPAAQAPDLTIDDEHYVTSETTVSEHSARLYNALSENTPNHLIWSSEDGRIGFMLESTINIDELINMANSVKNVYRNTDHE